MIARLLSSTFYFILFALGLYFTFLMVQLTLPYLSFKNDIGFLLTKQAILHLPLWKYSFYLHIFSSVFVLFTGLLQFSGLLLRNYPQWHRWLGKLYVSFILLLSAPTGLVMAWYASGGIWAKISFVLVAILWWVYTWLAYRKALQRNFKQHRAFMYRSFALTLSAITLRSYAWLLPYFAAMHHLHGREMYVWISWLSWVPNLLVAELLIRKPWSRKVTSQRRKPAVPAA